jgi:predicted TPR repeat methyltransferase
MKLVSNPSLAIAPLEDAYLGYDLDSHRLHRLNSTAALILELCERPRTAAELCDELAPLLGTGAHAACTEWIESARTAGLLVTAEDSRRSSPSPRTVLARARKLRDEGSVLGAFICQRHATLMFSCGGEEWMQLGELAHVLGRRREAREAYEQYLLLQPDDAEIAHILAGLRDEPMPPRAPDRCIQQLYARFAEFYDENMYGLDYRAPEYLRAALESATGGVDNLDVLDLGCGTGLSAKALRTRARHLVGIDLSPEMIARADKTGLYDVLEIAEITSWLARQNHRFDLIAACDSLIYFGDLGQVLAPAAQRIHRGGWMAFTVEKSNTGSFQLTDSGRYTHSMDHIETAACQAGFVVRSLTENIPRYEYGEPVSGLVAVLERL